MDIDFARSQFPALAGDWIFLDNAGGSQVLRAVADRVRDYLLSTSVQLGATYDASRRAAERVQEGVRAAATLIGADPGEVVLGSSATQLLVNLARAMEDQLGPATRSWSRTPTTRPTSPPGCGCGSAVSAALRSRSGVFGRRLWSWTWPISTR